VIITQGSVCTKMGSPHFGGVAWGGGDALHIMSAQRLLISHAIPHLIIRLETCSSADTDQAIGTGPPTKENKNILVHLIFHSHCFLLETFELESWTTETGPRFSEQTGAQPETGKKSFPPWHRHIRQNSEHWAPLFPLCDAMRGTGDHGGRGSPSLLPPHALRKQEPGSSNFGKGPCTAFVPHWSWLLRVEGKMY
jgi:hypothetical protein